MFHLPNLKLKNYVVAQTSIKCYIQRESCFQY